MKILLPEAFCETNEKKLAALGITAKKNWNKKSAEVDLALIKRASLTELHALVKEKAKPKSALAIVLRDIETWLQVVTGKGARPRNCQQLAAFLTEDLRRVPGHRVYKRESDGTWYAYYVGGVAYHPATRPGSTPHVGVSLYFEELGATMGESITLNHDDIRGLTPLEIISKKGYLSETDELRNDYLATRDRFTSIFDKIGKQFTAVGDATDNLDGNDKDSEYHTNTYRLDMNGRPARVVIDVFREDEKSSGGRESQPNWDFWSKKSVNSDSAEEEREEILDDAVASDDEDEIEMVHAEIVVEEIPIHPTCAVFDLTRHLRLRVHVSNLTEYAYNTKLGDSLVLPPDVRRLVDILMVQKGDFRDIIADKGGGAPILCAGPPGVGKTLTAEVYSEMMERPLYSVQCSQLGLTPDALENELLRCFRRAQRWSAILLLDEADVYVRARGDDLKQNAIVGVFLRVIEYYGGVLFLTTNRSDKVDDAIISRCVARIDYTPPSVDDQKRIWRILADTAGVSLSDETIGVITEQHSDLSGRDIKNLLKLGRMFARAEKKAVTVETITYARRFKPSAEQRKGRQS